MCGVIFAISDKGARERVGVFCINIKPSNVRFISAGLADAADCGACAHEAFNWRRVERRSACAAEVCARGTAAHAIRRKEKFAHARAQIFQHVRLFQHASMIYYAEEWDFSWEN